MPGNMSSPEKSSSLYAVMQAGAIDQNTRPSAMEGSRLFQPTSVTKSVNTEAQLAAAKQFSASQPVGKSEFQPISQLGFHPEGKEESLPTALGGFEIRNSVDDPREEQRLRELLSGGQERDRYARDPLGKYSPAENLAEGMIEYDKQPSPGSPEALAAIELYVQSMTEAAKKKNKDDDFEPEQDQIEKWRIVAQNEQLRKEGIVIKELDRNFRICLSAGNGALMNTALMIEAFVPPKPFEANMEERVFTDAKLTLERLATYFGESFNKEKIIGWYRAYDSVNEQQRALFNILCAAGGGMEGYYDALKQARETLISRARFHANAHDFRAAYTNKDPGVSTFKLTPNETAHIKDALASKEVRETQVEMLSKARQLIFLNTDAAQLDLDKDEGEQGLMKFKNPYTKIIKDLSEKADKLLQEGKRTDAAKVLKKRGEYEKLSYEATQTWEKLNIENNRYFMRLVFGRIDGEEGYDAGLNEDKWIKWSDAKGEKNITTPNEILTWYSGSDKLKDREEWLAKMMAMLVYVDSSGDKGLSEALSKASKAEVKMIAEKIIERAKFISANMGDKFMNANPEFAAAKIALVSWIEKDKGFQTSGRLAWQFVYKEIGGKIRRTYDTGGLYKAYDSVNLQYYWRRWVIYKATFKSATQFVMASSDPWRREVFQHGPDWLPPFDRVIENDRRIGGLWKRYTEGTPYKDGDKKLTEDSLWRARRLAGNWKLTNDEAIKLIEKGKFRPDMDPKILEILKKTGWSLETPYKNAEGKNISMPMFLPKTFELNIWALMVDKTTGESVMDMFARGVLPKDINWENYNYETLDRMWVSMSMLVRFAHLLVDPIEAERDPDYAGFFSEANTQSVAELSKRIYLAFRDLPQDYKPLIVAILPYMITQYTATSVGLTSTNLGSEEKEKIVKQWNLLMSQWLTAIMFMPNVILDDKQLYDGANQDILSLRSDLLIMVMFHKGCFEKMAQAAYDTDKMVLPNFYSDQMGLYTNSDEMKKIFEATGGEATWTWPNTDQFVIDILGKGVKGTQKQLFGERR